MSDVQVPPVSLEDLQAFHAKHFPWAQPASGPAYSNEETLIEDQIEEDDLGYYPDGVKRTLTDEQIKIFRHSEIHALLRKKQLREEELAEEAEREKEQQSVPNEAVAKDTPASVPSQESSSQPRPNPNATAKKSQETDSSDMTLDYGEGSGPSNPRPPVGRPPFAGRRIISYDD